MSEGIISLQLNLTNVRSINSSRSSISVGLFIRWPTLNMSHLSDTSTDARSSTRTRASYQVKKNATQAQAQENE